MGRGFRGKVSSWTTLAIQVLIVSQNRGRGGGGRGGGGGGGGGHWKRDDRVGQGQVERTNKRFESYYNDLDIIIEEERSAFWESLRSDLPNSFRFAGSRG